METGTLALNITAFVLFFGLAALAALLIMVAGKIIFGKWYSWGRFFLSALAGGVGGVVILIFGSKLQEVQQDTAISSISTLIFMTAALILAMMVIFPFLTMLLRQRRIKIRELEEEIRRLKNN